MQDNLYLQHFTTQTGIRLSSLLDLRVWAETIPTLSTFFPAIRYALLALSALHEMTLHSHNVPVDTLQFYSYRQYGKAIRRVNMILVDAVQNYDILQETLFACLLLVVYEVLRGNDIAALTHLEGAIRLVSLPSIAKYHLLLAEQPCTPSSQALLSGSIKDLTLIFLQLDFQAATFAGSRLPITPEDINSISGLSHAKIQHQQESLHVSGSADAIFNNVEGGRRVLLSIQVKISRFMSSKAVKWKYLTYLQRKRLNDEYNSVRLEQETLLQQLDHWKSGFDALSLMKDTIDCTMGDNRALRQWLKFQEQCAPIAMVLSYLTSYILLSTSLSPDEKAYDPYTAMFLLILEFSERILQGQQGNSGAETSSFCIDIRVIYPLYITAFKCRDYMIRHCAVNLLWMSGREGVWDGQLMALMAQRIISCEVEFAKQLETYQESLMNKMSDRRSISIPERARIHGASIVNLDREKKELRILCHRRAMTKTADNGDVWEEIPFEIKF